MIFKKLHWTIKRHPFLYMTRFRLLSQNTTERAIEALSYNSLNKKEDIPTNFNDVNSKIFLEGKPDTDLEVVQQLVIYLNKNTKVGPGLSESSDRALDTLINGKGGVCSDMAQVFNNLCVINDIWVREWGTTSAPFNRANGGHSFNEVFINELQKWVLIDASWGGLFHDNEKRPLSVIELFTFSRAEKPVFYHSLIKNKKIDRNLLHKNYLNQNIAPFLICNYRNKVYDKFLKIARPHIPVFIIHFGVYVIGRSYHYKFPINDYKNIFS